MLQANSMVFMNPNAFGPQLVQVQQPEPLVKKYQRTWTKKEIERVFELTVAFCESTGKKIEHLGVKDFADIAPGFPQSPEQILIKVNEIHRCGTLRPGIWSGAEDELLVRLLKNSQDKWGQVAMVLNKEIHNGLKVRNGKHCKERWNNHLNPDICRGPWSADEDLKLLQGFKVHGKKWSTIAKEVKNRTESSVKNRVKSLVNKIRQDLNGMEDLEAGIENFIRNAGKKKAGEEIQKSDQDRE